MVAVRWPLGRRIPRDSETMSEMNKIGISPQRYIHSMSLHVSPHILPMDMFKLPQIVPWKPVFGNGDAWYDSPSARGRIPRVLD